MRAMLGHGLTGHSGRAFRGSGRRRRTFDDPADHGALPSARCLIGLGPGTAPGRPERLEVRDTAVDVREVLIEEIGDEAAGLLAAALEVEDALWPSPA
ncbi:hypothetical protein MTF69_31895 [Streptomyces sp. AP-93]|nr:hypothetical protein [Streptomyces sp. AP-93]MCJ0873871.1 hypothetical protein [Streptomyces sp. AP-93]